MLGRKHLCTDIFGVGNLKNLKPPRNGGFKFFIFVFTEKRLTISLREYYLIAFRTVSAADL